MSSKEKAKGVGFVKMEGLGNDFILLDAHYRKTVPYPFSQLSPSFIQRLCDRHLGVGADQFFYLSPPSQVGADVRVEMWNADGSIAGACGNGMRAIGLYAWLSEAFLPSLVNQGGSQKAREYRIETLAGIRCVRVFPTQGSETALCQEVEVQMGLPQFKRGWEAGRVEGCRLKTLAGKEFSFFEVDMGNPHAVIFVDSPLTEEALRLYGSEIETHGLFPARTNVEFVQLEAENRLRVQVWERGAGVTLACGTGACAAMVASVRLGILKERTASVLLPGGRLTVEWAGMGEEVFLRGPARLVYEGVLDEASWFG